MWAQNLEEITFATLTYKRTSVILKFEEPQKLLFQNFSHYNATAYINSLWVSARL